MGTCQLGGPPAHGRVGDVMKGPGQLLSHQLNWRQRGTCAEGSESFT